MSGHEPTSPPEPNAVTHPTPGVAPSAPASSPLPPASDPAYAYQQVLYPPSIYQKCGRCGYDRSSVAPLLPCPECGRYAYAPGTPTPEELKAQKVRRERHFVWMMWLAFWLCVALAVGVVVLR